MKKLLTSLLLASTLTFGCTRGETQRFWRLVEISDLTYTSTPEEKERDMREFKYNIKKAMEKIPEEYTANNK